MASRSRPVHRQLPQGYAGALHQQLVQDAFRPVDLPLQEAVRRGLSQIVRSLHIQQTPQVPLPQCPQCPSHARAVRGMLRSCQATSCTTVSRRTVSAMRRPAWPPPMPGALRRMAVKVSAAQPIHCKAIWLSNIVKQHGQPQLRLRFYFLHGMESVLPHIVTMVAVPLVKPHHGQNLRPEDASHIRIGPQDLCGPFSGPPAFSAPPRSAPEQWLSAIPGSGGWPPLYPDGQ